MPDLMNYTPVGTREDFSRFNVEGMPKVGLLEGIMASQANSINQTIEGSLVSPIMQWYDKHFNGSKYLTSDEAKTSYPNVDFPEGGYENVISRASNMKARNDFTQTLLSHSSHPWIASNLGFLAANAPMPSAALTGFGVTKTAQLIDAYFLPKVAMGIAAVGRKAAVGGLATGVGVLPMLEAQDQAFSQMQEPLTTNEFLKNLFVMAGIGGVLHTVVGNKTPLRSEDQKAAFNVAQDQINNGKVVDVQNTIQEALSRNVKMEPEELEQMNRTTAEMDSRLTELDTVEQTPEVLAEKSMLNKLKDDTDVYQKLMNEKLDAPDVTQLVNNRNKILSFESDHSVFPNEYKKNEFVRNEFSSAEEEEELYAKQIDDLRENNLLSEEDIGVLDNLNEEDLRDNKIEKSLNDFVQCINERGL